MRRRCGALVKPEEFQGLAVLDRAQPGLTATGPALVAPVPLDAPVLILFLFRSPKPRDILYLCPIIHFQTVNSDAFLAADCEVIFRDNVRCELIIFGQISFRSSRDSAAA